MGRVCGSISSLEEFCQNPSEHLRFEKKIAWNLSSIIEILIESNVSVIWKGGLRPRPIEILGHN